MTPLVYLGGRRSFVVRVECDRELQGEPRKNCITACLSLCVYTVDIDMGFGRGRLTAIYEERDFFDRGVEEEETH